jgi:tetratricopeptide (TPR) repeat protein
MNWTTLTKNQIPWERWIHQLKGLLNPRPLEAALELAKNQWKSEPHHAPYVFNLARLNYQIGRVDEALAVYRSLMVHQMESGFAMKAIDTGWRMIRLAPEQPSLIEEMAELYLKLGMLREAVNLYRIAIQYLAQSEDKTRLFQLCKRVIEIDPSSVNRRRLAEIYQANGHIEEAIREYQQLAEWFKKERNYEELIKILELLLPHRYQDSVLLKDLVILYLRKQDADSALRLIERFKLDQDPVFKGLHQKATLLRKAIKDLRDKKKEAGA